jgi:hypothetical protein
MDHIYAFLGHPNGKIADKRVHIIEVNYKQTVEDTSVLLAEQFCVTSLSNEVQPLALLCYVLHLDDNDVEGLV